MNAPRSLLDMVEPDWILESTDEAGNTHRYSGMGRDGIDEFFNFAGRHSHKVTAPDGTVVYERDRNGRVTAGSRVQLARYQRKLALGQVTVGSVFAEAWRKNLRYWKRAMR